MKINKFEELWHEAENVSKTSVKKESSFNIEEIKKMVDEYVLLQYVGNEETKKVLKTKKIGELLFILASQTAKDNVNIFEGLMLEIGIRKGEKIV